MTKSSLTLVVTRKLIQLFIERQIFKIDELIFRPAEVSSNKTVELEIVWKIELSEKTDCAGADIDMRSPLALGQTSNCLLIRSQAVETLGCVEEEVLLCH